MKQLKLFVFLLFVTACNNSKSPKENLISVTIEPQRYFAEQIAGNKFTINCVVPYGQNPEAYDPTPQQMVQISKSKAYLQIGNIGFEQAWMENFKQNNKDVRFFDLTEGFNLIANPEEDGKCNHEEGHHHRHGETDPHIWSSVTGARTIAWNTLNALIELDKDNSSYYWENYNKMVEEIDQTAKTLSGLLKPVLSRAFIIYHPALTYFAEEFCLTQLCIEMDGKEPSPTQLKELVDTAKDYNVQVVFIQQEFDKKNAEMIAKETHCKLITINPLAYDWSKEMIHIAKSLADE